RWRWGWGGDGAGRRPGVEALGRCWVGVGRSRFCWFGLARFCLLWISLYQFGLFWAWIHRLGWGFTGVFASWCCRQRAVRGLGRLIRQWTIAYVIATAQKFFKAFLDAVIAVLAGTNDLFIGVFNETAGNADGCGGQSTHRGAAKKLGENRNQMRGWF